MISSAPIRPALPHRMEEPVPSSTHAGAVPGAQQLATLEAELHVDAPRPAALVKHVLLVVGPGNLAFAKALEGFKQAAKGIELHVVGDGRTPVSLRKIARHARKLPSLTPVILWAHGSMGRDHEVDLGKCVPTSKVLSVLANAGLLKFTVYSCDINKDGHNIAGSSLMEPGVLVRLQGGGKTSVVGDNQLAVQEQLGYYSACLADGKTPSDVEQCVSALYGSSQSVSFLIPKENLPDAATGSRVVHIRKAAPDQMDADEVRHRIAGLTVTDPDEVEIESPALKDLLLAAVERPLNETERAMHLGSALARQASWGKTDKVLGLLAKGADIHFRLADGATPLFLAATSGHIRVVEALLDRQADVNLEAGGGQTPLFMAAQGGHLEVIRELLKRGADVDRARKDEATPLFVAAEEGHVEVIRELLKRGADVNRAREGGVTPLTIAARKGSLEAVKALLESHADVDRATENGVTPLFMAAQEGHVDVVKALLDAKAEVNRADIAGTTPLFIAAFAGHVNVVEALLTMRADVDRAVKDGLTPLFIAAREGHVDVVKAPLDAKADVNRADIDGRTPLFMAAAEGHVNVVEALVDAGADFNRANNEGKSPLGVAFDQRHDDVISALIAVDADV